MKAMATAIGAALIIPQFIPGGSDKVLDSITKGGDEVALAIGLGIPISLATRRFNKKGSIARNFPEMTGLMEALPRGALTQVISSWMRSPDTVGPVIEKFGTDPALFGEFTRELGDAMASGNAGALGKTVKRLQKDVKFRQILNDSEDNVIGDFVGP